MRSAKVFFGEIEAGIIRESEDGYQFTYSELCLNNKDAYPISLTLPLRPDRQAKTDSNFEINRRHHKGNTE